MMAVSTYFAILSVSNHISAPRDAQLHRCVSGDKALDPPSCCEATRRVSPLSSVSKVEESLIIAKSREKIQENRHFLQWFEECFFPQNLLSPALHVPLFTEFSIQTAWSFENCDFPWQMLASRTLQSDLWWKMRCAPQWSHSNIPFFFPGLG